MKKKGEVAKNQTLFRDLDNGTSWNYVDYLEKNIEEID
jgi:hypothetical protein